MAEMKEAKAEKRSYKKLMGLHTRRLANGGHIVSHEHHDGGMAVGMPKEHAFSKEDGMDGTTMAHLKEHYKSMGIHDGGGEAVPAEEEA